jgi:hypothetical protein
MEIRRTWSKQQQQPQQQQQHQQNRDGEISQCSPE